jgi:hypothetical protein
VEFHVRACPARRELARFWCHPSVFAGAELQVFWSIAECTALGRSRVAMGIFCLYIRVKLKVEMIDEFKARWGILATHVKANEPSTLSCA